MRRVLIVGGGSSGWITATYLDAVLNRRGQKTVDITLVESPAIGRIGVGEATIPTIRETLKTIGIDELSLMRTASATFKQGIDFRDWKTLGHSYFHPFDRCAPSNYFDNAGAEWLFSNQAVSFADTVSAQPRCAYAGLSPKLDKQLNYQGLFNYAYHMDAEAFAEYLAELGTSRGVKRVLATVKEVGLRGDGNVSFVRTGDGTKFAADLFIDCSGFSSLLRRQAMQAEFLDYSQWLPCDRAVVLRQPHALEKNSNLKPYTTATAMSAGWRWDISLQNRRGIGYVHSSRFISESDAEVELREATGLLDTDIEPLKVRFKTGRLAAQWEKNCLAIGLSGGFVEPLESTGLYLVEIAAKTLCEYFPYLGSHDELSERFNKIIGDRYEEILDFIVLHYCLSERRDSEFWEYVTNLENTPKSLYKYLKMLECKPPSEADFASSLRLFSYINYEYILFGMDWTPRSVNSIPADNRRPAVIPKVMDEWVEHARNTCAPHTQSILTAVNA
ncbi:tryptophan halogenase family protein [uncultured Roseibium sp.]|uniref:tryptophan halogenase family protein n=1 Tax=uncultured Roseibium sp. TaxID=1936171 RepID=UPI0026325C07|nr:tryptophan halogenase family protein [uncultured Roseibium sp.]